MRKLMSLHTCAMLLVVCFLLTGCGTNLLVPQGLMEPLPEITTQIAKTETFPTTTKTSLDMGKEYYLIVDNSMNMKGFSSERCNTFDVIRAACLEASQNGTRICYTPTAKQFSTDWSGDISKETLAMLESEATSALDSESFFNKMSGDDFFKAKPLEAETLTNLFDYISANSSENSVCIFVSDLMLASEAQCIQVADTIRSKMLGKDGMTIGIIGILGDYFGNIKNYPGTERINLQLTTSVIDRDNYGNFRHPIYMVFLGNENLVYSTMERTLNVLKRSSAIDDTNPIEVALFSGYKTEPSTQSRITLQLQNNLADHNYEPGFIFKGVRMLDNDEPQYPAKGVLKSDEIELIESVPIARVYDGERGDSTKNIHLQMTLPYEIVVTPNYAELGSKDKFGLLSSLSKVIWNADDFSLNIDFLMLDYIYSKSGDPMDDSAQWVRPDKSLIYSTGEATFTNEGTPCFDIDLTLNVDALERDVPLIFKISLSAIANPSSAHYTTDELFEWVEDWTLDNEEYMQEFDRYRSKPNGTSAEFTEITTAHTPYLSSLFGQSLYDTYSDVNTTRLATESAGYSVSTVFGVVVRGIPEEYEIGNWRGDQNFGGWMFSRDEVEELLSK